MTQMASEPRPTRRERQRQATLQEIVEARDVLARSRQVLEEEGITIHTGASAQRLENLPDGTIRARDDVLQRRFGACCERGMR